MLNLYLESVSSLPMKFGKYLENLSLKAPASIEILPKEILEKYQK